MADDDEPITQPEPDRGGPNAPPPTRIGAGQYPGDNDGFDVVPSVWFERIEAWGAELCSGSLFWTDDLQIRTQLIATLRKVEQLGRELNDRDALYKAKEYRERFAKFLDE